MADVSFRLHHQDARDIWVAATAGEQIGYSIADVVAKAVFGVLIWAIAAEKSKLEDEGSLLKNAA
jgi:NAD-dependent oxidoreductase involved in siderophore biosynthesis